MAEELTHSETILVVDDESSVCVSLEGVLAREGYRTLSANDGPTALRILNEQPVDLVLLDLNMPVMSGLELMHVIRERWPNTVIMILTGYGTLESAVSTLRYGAHDYLLKPSTPQDIQASVRKGLDNRRKALRRRQLLSSIEASVRELTQVHPEARSKISALEQRAQPEETLLAADNLLIDLQQHRVTLYNQEIALTPIEFNTLVVLVRNHGRVLSYASIVKNTHGYDCTEQEARTLIKTHISHLRQKIARHSKEPCPIANVRGVGYMWSDAQQS
jgi:two-component system response regulator VanR